MDNATTVEEAVASTKKQAAELAYILDMQGLVALLAHVLYHQALLASMVDKTGFPRFTEDQIFAIILTSFPDAEHVELGGSLPEAGNDPQGPSCGKSTAVESNG
jgi:hypothetical protein